MTPTRTSVHRSTAGGRSVLRSAASVQAAALRLRPLVARPALSAFANPLSGLLSAAPDLSVLEPVLGRTDAGHPGAAAPRGSATTADPASGDARRSPRPGSGLTAVRRPGEPPVAADGAGVPGVRRAEGAAASRGPAGASAPAQPGVLRPVSTASLGTAASLTVRPAAEGIRGGGTQSVGTGARSRRPGHPEGVPEGPGTATPAMPTDPVTEPGASPLDRHRAPGDEPGPHGPRMQGSPAAAGAGWTTGKAHAAAAVPTLPVTVAGALAEAVSRWEQAVPFAPSSAAPPPAVPGAAEPGPAPAPTDAQTVGPTSGSLVGALTGLTPVDATPVASHDHDEDRIERALEQLLRREVERHGLDGGLR